MSINLVDFPTVPSPVAGDWEKLVTIVTKSFQNINDPLQVSGTLIPEGATFQVGGNVYYCDADTTIAGTASDYVQLAVSGTTLVPTFVVDLTGVTWNKIYNGYYDANGYLYLFDEVKAILAGTLVGSNSKFSELWNEHIGQNVKPTDSPTFASINTGQGANELYAMDQNVRTTDSPTFNSLLFNSLQPLKSIQTYISLAASSYTVIPNGFYIFVPDYGTNLGPVYLQTRYLYNGTYYWIASDQNYNGGAVMSDGINVRFHNAGDAITISGRKF